MKNLLILLAFFTLLSSCKKDDAVVDYRNRFCGKFQGTYVTTSNESSYSNTVTKSVTITKSTEYTDRIVFNFSSPISVEIDKAGYGYQHFGGAGPGHSNSSSSYSIHFDDDSNHLVYVRTQQDLGVETYYTLELYRVQ